MTRREWKKLTKDAVTEAREVEMNRKTVSASL